jgi:cell division protein FtsA
METGTNSEFVVALDVGSSRTRCLIGECQGGRLQVIGRGDEQSRGVRRGEVIDLAAATYSVNRAISAAEEQADVQIQTLFLATGSRHVSFFNNRVCIAITRENRTANARDKRKVLEKAEKVPIRDDAKLIGTLVCSYALDDVRQVREPVGMHGTRLEVEVHVITDARSTAENIAATIDNDRYEIEQHVFPAYAAGQAVLDDDMRKLGAAVIDIGAGTTRIMLYRDHAPVFSSVVPIGGDHITHDVATGMELGLADAASLKEQHACVGPARIGHTITFQPLAQDATYSVEPRRLHAIVDCRTREILDIARRELLRAGVRPASVRTVLTGGTSRLPGIDGLASTILGCPVTIGRLRHPALAAMGPEMATAAGMLLVGLEARKEQAEPVATSNGPGRLMNWLRQLF